MRNKTTAPVTSQTPDSSSKHPRGLIAKKNSARSAGAEPVLDDRSHRTAWFRTAVTALHGGERRERQGVTALQSVVRRCTAHATLWGR